MRPQFEHVTLPPGASWALLWRELPEIPFIWHYHPEFELTLTLNARGQRYVGDHLADFEPGDLVLVGPNQPHTWAATERADAEQPMLAVVVWFSQEWLERLVGDLPELAPLRRLAQAAGRSLAFSGATAQLAQALLLALKTQDPAARVPTLLQVLLLLANDEAAQALASTQLSASRDVGKERLNRILDRLHRDFTDPPSIAILAEQAALSVGAFHRFFKRHTGQTVLSYLTQLRIGHACQLLIATDKPIGVIASESGYQNLAHFNRQFLASRQLTPRALRARYRSAEAPSSAAGLP
ncbi:AraC family transcriptional regulator [Chitinimonas naiadis]